MSVSILSGIAVIEYDVKMISIDKIIQEITSLNYEATLVSDKQNNLNKINVKVLF